MVVMVVLRITSSDPDTSARGLPNNPGPAIAGPWGLLFTHLCKQACNDRKNKPRRFAPGLLCPELDSNQHILADAAT